MDDTPDQYNVEDLVSGGDCTDAIRTLYVYLDGELTPERRDAIQRHLHECSPCLSAYDFESELRALVARCCRDQVPDSLRQKIAEALGTAAGSAPDPETTTT